MKQIKCGVSGTILKSHEENGITVIDEFNLDGASVIAESPNPFIGPLTDEERKDMEQALDRVYPTAQG